MPVICYVENCGKISGFGMSTSQILLEQDCIMHLVGMSSCSWFIYVPCPGRLEVHLARVLQDSCAIVQVALNPLHCTGLTHGEKNEFISPLAHHNKSLMTCIQFRVSGICCALLTLQLPDWLLHWGRKRRVKYIVVSNILLHFCKSLLTHLSIQTVF